MAPLTTGKVVRDEVTTVRTVTSIGPVDGDPLGTFGWFITVRHRGRPGIEARDRRRYGTCAICRHTFTDDDQIHMVFNVTRNNRRVGNRLCCSSCAAQHATHHHRPAATKD